MLIRGHAETVRRFLALGALLYDALTVFMGLEPKDVKKLGIEARFQLRRDPAAALFDSAQAHGKL